MSRSDAEAAIARSLNRNWCPVIYGDYGVGKTTVVLRYFADQQAKGRLVYLPTAANLTMPKLFERFLEHLNYTVETERTAGTTSELDASFDGTVVKAGMKTSDSASVTNKLVVTSPTDPGIIKLVDAAELSIIIDEMHRASETFRSDLAAFIKSTRVAASSINLVLVGTSTDALHLVRSDPGIDRFVKDAHLPLMTPEESTSLVRAGFGKLDIGVSDAVVQLMVEVSAGAPSILQSLCLDAAESVRTAAASEVRREHLVAAIQQYIADNSGRMI